MIVNELRFGMTGPLYVPGKATNVRPV